MIVCTVFRGPVLPSSWYNVLPDLPFKLPPLLRSRSGFPVGRHELVSVLPEEIVEQEIEGHAMPRLVKVPGEVREAYQTWRPTRLVRAKALEEALGTPARLYYKYEGESPTGSHELNTALPQAYYARRAQAKTLVAGAADAQWAAAVAMAASRFGLAARVYMGRGILARRPRLKAVAEVWGGQIIPSPSQETRVGRAALNEDPNAPGTMALAFSEAIEEATTQKGAKCAFPTLMNHVVLHQTVVGLEARRQMERLSVPPDVVIGAVGGGSNFGGLVLPFLELRLEGRPLRFVAAEAASCPSLTRGAYAYDYVDSAGLLPLMKMYTLGSHYVPPNIEAEGMRYHGVAPIVSALHNKGFLEVVAVSERAAMESAVLFARTEGVLIGTDAAHCVQAVVQEARRCRESGEQKTVLFGVSGHGHFNLAAYQDYFGELVRDALVDEAGIQKSLRELPRVEPGG